MRGSHSKHWNEFYFPWNPEEPERGGGGVHFANSLVLTIFFNKKSTFQNYKIN